MAENEDQAAPAEQVPRSGGEAPPSLKSKAFCCPHCGAYTHQFWYSTLPKGLGKDALPSIPDASRLSRLDQMPDIDKETREKLRRRWRQDIEKHRTGNVFFEEMSDGIIVKTVAKNLHLSKCFTCGEIAVWVYQRLVYPHTRTGPGPNEDLPANVKSDYEEARSILDLSPRGAAALLRLCVEKLCIHLKAKGSTLDERIGDLVKRGLSIKVKKALDSVRVIGNEAVHPGQMDLKDDRDTAETLFGLVNIIAERMISEPKHIDAIFGSLPKSKLDAIERRDRETKEE